MLYCTTVRGTVGISKGTRRQHAERSSSCGRLAFLEADRPVASHHLKFALPLLLHRNPLQHADIVLVRQSKARERVQDPAPSPVGAVHRLAAARVAALGTAAVFVADDDCLGERILDLVVGEPERARDLGHLLHELEVVEVFLCAELLNIDSCSGKRILSENEWS